MLCAPSDSGDARVRLQLPSALASVLPSEVLPSKSSTVLPPSTAPAAPTRVGVVTLVRSSVLKRPLSLAADRSGAAGLALTVSLVLVRVAAAEVLPAASVAVTR